MTEQTVQQPGPDKVGLYQLKSGEGYDDLHLCSYAKLIGKDRKAYVANYNQVLLSDLLAKDTPIKILQRFINHLPEDFPGHPIEVGDVIAIKQHGVQSAYYVDEVSDTKILIALPDFFTKAEDETMTATRGVEEHQPQEVPEPEMGSKEMPEPRVLDGRRSVLDGLKIKKEQVKQYRPPEKHDKDKDKGKGEEMDI